MRRVAIPALLLALHPMTVAAQAPTVAGEKIALHKVQQDVAAAELLQSLAARGQAEFFAFRNVTIVDPASGTVESGQSVIVTEGRIAWVGGTAAELKVPGIRVIDGTGRYLAPGLTDMHAHSSHASAWLLDLAAGVTAVRDMGGFPWMLRARDAINSGKMLAPSLYVAGPIFNRYPLDGYAAIPANSLDARRMVRQQAACGYDFVKVHNGLSRPVFDAIAQQARTLGMDVVGHVPHDIPIRHAVDRGMRTMEHLKGFLNDRTLEAGDTDFAAAGGDRETWVTPTLYATRTYAFGKDAAALLERPESRYVPARIRGEWAKQASRNPGPNEQKAIASVAIGRSIVASLKRAGAHFLTGTDADFYPFQVMGFGVLDEIDMLRQAGLTAAEAYRAATVEPARAMRQGQEFGAVRKGMRADLLLLDANPLQDSAALRRSRGVMAHGIWLDRASLDAALDRLAAINGAPDDRIVLSPAAVAAAAARATSLSDAGFVFDSTTLMTLANIARARGWSASAEGLSRVAAVPQSGPCAAPRS